MNKLIRFFSIIALSFCCTTSCNNISIEDITIIDNIELGGDIDKFDKQMDSLSIPKSIFLTKMNLMSSEDILDLNNNIKMYYTTIFDFVELKGEFNNNIGLLYPSNNTEINANVGLTVILGHTKKPRLLLDAIEYENFVPGNYFSPDLANPHIIKIEKLYKEKYGKPTSEKYTKDTPFYVINNNTIKKFIDPTRVGKEITWKTKYINITFFEGLKSYDNTFKTDQKYYKESLMSLAFGANGTGVYDPLEKNETNCFSYAYIKYELNSEALKELKLDVKKI
jgi:effector-binding domain-containing protein